MTPRARHVVEVALLAVSLSGCGAILSGSRQGVLVLTEPSSAEVRTDPNALQYWTPASLWLRRNRDYTLTIELEGYSTATIDVRKRLRPGIVIADALLTAGLGIAIDALTGSMYRLSPDSVQVTLTKVNPIFAGPEHVNVVVRVGGWSVRER